MKKFIAGAAIACCIISILATTIASIIPTATGTILFYSGILYSIFGIGFAMFCAHIEKKEYKQQRNIKIKKKKV